MKRQAIGMVGAGSWGTVLSWLLAENGHQVRLWTRDEELAATINRERRNARYFPDLQLPDSIRATARLADVTAACDLIFLTVPSTAFRPVARALGDTVDGAHVLVHGTNGIERGTFCRMSQIVMEETCCKRVGVISGPNLARELARRSPSATVVASRFAEVCEMAASVLQAPHFRVYAHDDVIGVELGGALKNILAIAAGISDGLGLGVNTKAMLLTRGIVEISRFGEHLDAKRYTFAGLSGIGDLLASCFSPLSRNYQFGSRLAKGESPAAIIADLGEMVEGVQTSQTVHEYIAGRDVDMPITHAVFRVIHEGVSPQEAMHDLLNRPPRRRQEFDDAWRR